MTDDFYHAEPNARTSWRLAVLMGANRRTYKFALGEALLTMAEQGHTDVRVGDLAVPYAMGLVRHLTDAPQAHVRTELGDKDFLTVAAREAAESQALGRPTERLLAAARSSMPAMVMRKFHNLRDGVTVPHHFYELDRSARKDAVVRLTPAIREIAVPTHVAALRAELGARWSIVENSFAVGVGASLVTEGFAVDTTNLVLTDKQRRRSVAGVSDAMLGFQHGRCLICGDIIAPDDRIAVDHVFPYSLMRRFGSVGAWTGPDLDQLWNLAPAHEVCNSAKSDRLPNSTELRRLAERNEAIMYSPHPLCRTLELTIRRWTPGRWRTFLRQVQDIA